MLCKAFLSPALFGLCALSASAAYADSPASPTPKVAATSPAKPAALDDSELAGMRGGYAIVIANQTLSSIAAGNSIGGNVTAGAVNLSDNALSSFSGLGNIVINTGSQVSVQSGMNVTINLNQ
jgi:hypothetical protein